MPRGPGPQDSDADSWLSAEGPFLDRALVDACLAGDPNAWDDLYHQCHDWLLTTVCRILIQQNCGNLELADEIAARVWFEVIRDDAALLDRFDPRRGFRLRTYLAGIAKGMLAHFVRSEIRRRRREAESATRRMPTRDFLSLGITLDEFRQTLTPAEQKFYSDVLLAAEMDPVAAGYSRTNAWQLSSRICRKLTDRLSGNGAA
jgi:DNA-directed RNA polymerase specialized sigma24 family protein